MAQATEKRDPLLWLQGMSASLDRLPVDQAKRFLLTRLREINQEIDELTSTAPSGDWLLQRIGGSGVDLQDPAWDSLLYLEYLRSTRRAIVAALRMF